MWIHVAGTKVEQETLALLIILNSMTQVARIWRQNGIIQLNVLKRSEILFILLNFTQLLNFDEVYIMIYQPYRPDMHRGKRYRKSITVLLNYQLHKSKRKNKHKNVNIFYIFKF